MRQVTRLNDVFPTWMIGGGIFGTLQSLDVPWQTENIAASLDLEYHGNVSGDKLISPLIQKIKSGDTLTESEKLALATAILAVNGASWGKQWATLEFEYNPIENYSMTEIMEDDTTEFQYGKTHMRTDALSHGKTGTETLVLNTTETRTDNLSHGKTGTETLSPNTTETRTDNLSHSKTGTETLTPNTTETRTDNLTHSTNDSTTREPDLMETTTPNLVNTTADGVYGFNSVSASSVPSTDRRQTASGTSTIATTGTDDTTRAIQESNTGTSALARTGTETTQYNTTDTDTGTSALARTGTETTQYNTSETDTGTSALARTGTETTQYDTEETDTGTVTDRDSGTDAHVRNYELTRKGNIGVTTSQQMIESERNLWIWRFFYDVVFPDIDRMLTIPIY